MVAGPRSAVARGSRVEVAARLGAIATYHDSCSGLRELGVHDQPRALLRTVEGLRLAEMRDANVCCGFGGTFCVKYPEISDAIVAKKAANIAATGAGLLLAGDLGCLMNMAGKLQREGSVIWDFRALGCWHADRTSRAPRRDMPRLPR